MPIYSYECRFCGHKSEVIDKVVKESFKDEKPRVCSNCHNASVFKVPSMFRLGTHVLDTSKLTGYDTDELTMGKLIDEGGIPYEFKDDLEKRNKRVEETKTYIKEVKQRGKDYGFDPFSVDDKELNA